MATMELSSRPVAVSSPKEGTLTVLGERGYTRTSNLLNSKYSLDLFFNHYSYLEKFH